MVFCHQSWAKAIGKSAIFFQNWLRKKVTKHNTGIIFLTHVAYPTLTTQQREEDGALFHVDMKNPRLTELPAS